MVGDEKNYSSELHFAYSNLQEPG